MKTKHPFDPQMSISRNIQATARAEHELELKRDTVANRIAKRALKKIEKGKYPVVVKGGRLALASTIHEPEVYSKVDEKLQSSGIDAEVYTIRETEWDFGVPFSYNVADVVVPVRIGDFPTSVAKHPTDTPEVFDTRLNMLRTSGDYDTSRVYPPVKD